MGIDEDKKPDEEVGLTADEIELLRLYRKATDYQKPGVLFILSQMDGNDWIEPSTHAHGRPGNHVSLGKLFKDGYLSYPIDYQSALEYGKEWVKAFD